MSEWQLEHGIKQLDGSLEREIDALRQRIVDRAVRIAEAGSDLLACVKSEGADGASTARIAALVRDLETAKEKLRDREEHRARIGELVRLARRTQS